MFSLHPSYQTFGTRGRQDRFEQGIASYKAQYFEKMREKEVAMELEQELNYKIDRGFGFEM